MRKRAKRAELCERITSYLVSGGLFNPEMAIHERVRDLLIECRDALRPLTSREAGGSKTEEGMIEYPEGPYLTPAGDKCICGPNGEGFNGCLAVRHIWQSAEQPPTATCPYTCRCCYGSTETHKSVERHCSRCNRSSGR